MGKLSADAKKPPESGIPLAGSRPNIVLIMTDDQHLTSLQYMPRTQRLAQQGTTFSNFFSSYPLCCPSRATFLTGQYAHNHGVMGNSPPEGGYGKLDHENTLAVWLQNAGFHTAHIGKYLNGYGRQDTNPDDDIPPEKEIPPGWTEWYGSIDPSTYSYYGYTLNENGNLVTYGESVANYQTDVYARKAVKFLRERAYSAAPFFLSVAFLAPHDDLVPPPGPRPALRHVGSFSNEPLPRPPSFNEWDMSDKPSFLQTLSLLSPQDIGEITTSYQRRLESLLAVDEAVGEILGALSETGRRQNTVVIFMSDNGFLHGEHRIPSGKLFLYEESIQVPLIVFVPGLPGGRVIPKLTANIDLAPTIAHLTGIVAGRVPDGRSLLPILVNPNADWRESLLMEAGDIDSLGGILPGYEAVRTDGYIYAEHENGEREFYDLWLDRYQIQSQHNSTNPTYRQLMAALSQRLAVLRNCAGENCR